MTTFPLGRAYEAPDAPRTLSDDELDAMTHRALAQRSLPATLREFRETREMLRSMDGMFARVKEKKR